MRWLETYHLQICAVCYIAPRRTDLMIPGTYICPSDWTREYYDYLMSERHNYQRSTVECMDVALEIVAGGHANLNGALFYHIEPRCGVLPCPPYVQRNEITCTVCSK